MKPAIRSTLFPGTVFTAFAILLSSGFLKAQTAPEKPTTGKTPGDEILTRFTEDCVLITPGTAEFPATFLMGGETAGPLGIPAREVTMSQSFRIGRYEVTQELYQTVIGANPSRWKGARNSVEMVSCVEAEVFCARLTAALQSKKLLAGTEQVRLPTEAEWEYCCRAGTKTRYSFGDSATAEPDKNNQAALLDPFAWHTGNAAGNDPVVGSLKPNPWGLYDMHGYLWEFVAEPYSGNSDKASPSPKTDTPSIARVIRGGSWRDHHSLLTSDYRTVIPEYAASDAIGFRCVIADSAVK